MSKADYPLQSVAGRWCNRPIDELEDASLVRITNEVHAITGDMGLVGLLSDYIRLGREYGDMMNTDSANMRKRITELETMLRNFKKYTTIAAHDREQIYKTLMSIDMDIDDYFNGEYRNHEQNQG